MAASLVYDGQTLEWNDGKSKKSFKASSGVTANAIRVFRVGTVVFAFFEDYRWSWYEKLKDHGPIPSGTFTVESAILKQPWAESDPSTCSLKVRWGIEQIPRGDPNPKADGDLPHGSSAGDCEPYWSNWGSNRVRLSPHRDMVAPHRGGFYIHDSVKGYSHGCIETELDFFASYLVPYAKAHRSERFLAKVKYKHERTYGGTYTDGKGVKSGPGAPETAQVQAITVFKTLCDRLAKNAPLASEAADAKTTKRPAGIKLDPPPQDRLKGWDGKTSLNLGPNDLSGDPAKLALFTNWWGNFQ